MRYALHQRESRTGVVRMSGFAVLASVLLCCAWGCGPTLAFSQSPVVIPPASVAPATALSGSACSPGFAEIVATHFHVNQDPNSAVLQKGTLKIRARRGWVEERGSSLITYRNAAGTSVVEMDVPILDGAIEHPVCLPVSSVYVTSPMRYQMTVTDDNTNSALLLLVTADLTQSRYRLDDEGLYRTEPGDENALGRRTALAAGFKECAESSWCGRE